MNSTAEPTTTACGDQAMRMSNIIAGDNLGPMDRSRIFTREWRRNPSLSKSSSLPVLSLVPHNRPLFTCRNCKFANPYIPLCLWCAWSSPEDTTAFEAACTRVPRRRASGPMLLISRSLQRDFRPTAVLTQSSNQALNSGSTAKRPAKQISQRSSTTETSSHIITATDRQSSPESVTSLSRIPKSERSLMCVVNLQSNKHRSIGRALEVGVAAGRVNDGKYLRARRKRLPRFSSSTTTFTTTVISSEDDPRPVRIPMSSLPTRDPSTNASLVRSRHRAAAVGISAALAITSRRSDDRPSTAPMPEPASSFRRIPGDMRMRKRSSQSLRERSKSPADDPILPSFIDRGVKGSTPPMGAQSARPSANPSPPRTPEPRLGHPSRPYYTAIRKNMSQPASPLASPTPTVTPQPGYFSPRPSTERSVRESADHTPKSSSDYLARLSSGAGDRGSLPTRRGGGGSVSGEIELHMALAQRRSEDAPHARPEYIFRETPAPPELRQRHGRLRRLSNSVRNLFFGRS